MFYRRALHSQRKADLSMNEFLMKIKGFCINLTSCSELISKCEHVTAILNGLSTDYESVITIITANQVPYTVQAVTTMLLDAEARQQLAVLEIPSSVNMVSSQPTVSDNNDTPTLAYRHYSSGRNCGRGRTSGSNVQCQLYRKSGHLVDRCYYWFDATYKSSGYRPPPAPQANLCMFGNTASAPLWPAMSMPIPTTSTQPE
ncbi:hypothetical protein J1N35_038976 [Gossypium stocksii]|uniref:Uncharacterized protein n=1 Tax=Gossypium stocksii TaxID=47602 RepID=A0A9D3UMX9_9ROSI|nr:hypothetical protein J1N35_038976 [Gossypium stocksii]